MWQKIRGFFYDRDNQKKYLSWLFRQAGPYRLRILMVMLLRCAATLVGVSMAVVNKHVVDRASQSLGMAGSIALLIGMNVLSLGLSTGINMFVNVLTEKYSFHMRSAIYGQLMRSHWDKLQKYHSEDLLTRLTSDVNNITNGIVTIFGSLIALIVQLVSAFLLLIHYDWTLAVFVIFLAPIAAISSVVFGVKLKELQTNFQKVESAYRVYLQENLAQMPVIKAFCREEESQDELTRLRNDRLYWVRKKNFWSTFSNICLNLAFSGGYLFAFINGAFKIARGTITYGTMTAFLSLVNQVQGPMIRLAETMPQIVGILASAGRVMEIDDLEKEELHDVDLTKYSKTAVGVRGTNISFHYEERQIFCNFNFDIRPGTMTAVMGPSGAGKTTLVRMLLAFITPQSGSIQYYAANEAADECSASTRKLLSYVPQGNTLFAGTIAANLRIGNPDATQEKMKEALKAASAWEFVAELTDGMNTLIGEKAAGLSEGQAQRIAIARMLISPAPILLLDEATSALDEHTEQKVFEYIQDMENRPTCIIITHRSSVEKYMDQIIKVEPVEMRRVK